MTRLVLINRRERHGTLALEATDGQRGTILETHTIGHLGFERPKCPLAGISSGERTVLVWIKTQTVSEPGTIRAFDRLAETLYWGEELMCEVIVMVFTGFICYLHIFALRRAKNSPIFSAPSALRISSGW